METPEPVPNDVVGQPYLTGTPARRRLHNGAVTDAFLGALHKRGDPMSDMQKGASGMAC